MMYSFLRLLPLFFLLNCSSKAQVCKVFLEDASRTYDNYLFTKNTRKLDSALFFVDQALKCTPENSSAIILKAKILFADRNYQAVLDVLEKLDPINTGPDLNSIKGFTFKRLHLTDSSKIYFKKSLDGYNDLLKSDASNFSNLLGYLQMVYLLEGRETFEKEVDKYEKVVLQHNMTIESLKETLISSYKASISEN